MMKNIKLPSPHGDKLDALVKNAKLPSSDMKRVTEQIARYHAWVVANDSLTDNGDALLVKMVNLLNEYKKSVEFDFIFCAQDDFLYRQKGQLKIDNTVLEEFLPRLFDPRLVPGLEQQSGLECGPQSSFAGLSFESPLMPLSDGGVYLKKKDQDFSVSRKHRMVIMRSDRTLDRLEIEFHVSYFATEIKTNLDKTMFQEAAATASELKRATSGSKYIVLCEWLDMTPINTKLTAIDEVIVLRKSKRLGSQMRSVFSSSVGREQNRQMFEKFLDEHPLSIDGFRRFVSHLNECFPTEVHSRQEEVLGRGYF